MPSRVGARAPTTWSYPSRRGSMASWPRGSCGYTAAEHLRAHGDRSRGQQVGDCEDAFPNVGREPWIVTQAQAGRALRDAQRMHAALPFTGDGVGHGHLDAAIDEFHAGRDHAGWAAGCGEVFVDAGNARLCRGEQRALTRGSAGAKDHVGMLTNKGSRLSGAPGRVGVRRVASRLISAENAHARPGVACSMLKTQPVSSIHGAVRPVDAGDDT